MEAVKFLIGIGANVNLLDRGGRTPLHAAALNGKTNKSRNIH